MSRKLGSVKRSSSVGEPVGVQDDEHADDDHRQLQAEVGEGEHASERCRSRPVTLRMLSTQAAAITARGDADLPARLGEAVRDRLQVVRHRDRRQGDHDQVVDQDRPAGDEGDQLVEGVAGEGRGAAALAEHRPALDVAERGQDEQQAGGEEDQRRQAEAAVGDDAEREVDREADRRVGGGEQPGHAERRACRRRLRTAASRGCSLRLARSSLASARRSRAGRRRRRGRRGPSGSRPRAGRRRWPGSPTRTTRPSATKTSEKPRTAPLVDPLGDLGRPRPGPASGLGHRAFGRVGDDDHPAGPLAEHRLQGLVVERRAVAVAQADDDAAALISFASSEIE